MPERQETIKLHKLWWRLAGESVMFRYASITTLSLVLALSAASATAQELITIVAPSTAGGATDSLARTISAGMENLGGNYIVQNKPGSNGVVGGTFVARTPPDGTTWLFAATGLFAIHPLLHTGDGTFDPLQDLRIVREIGFQPSVLAVGSESEIDTVQEFLEKGKEGRIRYGSGGVGSTGHLAMEYFGMEAGGLNLTHIPYGAGVGSGMTIDLIGNRLDATFGIAATSMSFINSGQMKALAVSGLTRHPELPDVPTVAEIGFPGFEVSQGYVIAVPAETPDNIVQDIRTRLDQMLSDSDFADRIRLLGMEPSMEAMSEDELLQWLTSERTKWGKVISDADLKLR